MQTLYTTIIHEKRIALKLSLNDYCVADSIDKLSRKTGWCTASRDHLSEFLGIGVRTVQYIIKDLLERGFVEQDEKFHLRPTEKWINYIILGEEVQDLHPKDAVIAPNSSSDSSSFSSKEEKGEAPNFETFKKDTNTKPHSVMHQGSSGKSKDKSDVPFEDDPNKYGNGQVNNVLISFRAATGHDATDKEPRRAAWNTYQKVNTFLKSHPQLEFKHKVDYVKFLDKYSVWMKKQSWCTMVQKVETYKLKLPLYFAIIERVLATNEKLEKAAETRKKQEEEIANTPVNNMAVDNLATMRASLTNKLII